MAYAGSHRALLSGSAFLPQAQALFARFTTPPTQARKILINRLITSLLSAGVWTKLDALYLFAAADAQAASLNWLSANYTAIPVNSPTFVADRGYTGDGASSRLRTQYVPATNGVNFTLNDSSEWVYCLTDVDGAQADVGSTISGGQTQIQSRRSSTQIGVSLNDATFGVVSSISTSIGLTGVSRTASNARKTFRNGVQLGATSTAASTSVTTAEQWVCAANSAIFSTRQIAFAAWGGSLAGLEPALYTAVFTYLKAVGAA